MRRLRVYRWSDSLIPGFMFALFTIILVIPEIKIKAFIGNIGASEITIILVLGSFISYIFGTVSWGIAYIIRAGSIMSKMVVYAEKLIRLISIKVSIGEFARQEEVDERTKYRGRRLTIANKILSEICNIKNEKKQDTFYLKNYHEFRLVVFTIVEELGGEIGDRIRNQWEYLGLLQSLFAVSLLFEVAFLLTYVMDTLGYITLNSLPFQYRGGPLTLILSNLLILISLAMVYSHRNDIFARDVAYAYSMIHDKERYKEND